MKNSLSVGIWKPSPHVKVFSYHVVHRRDVSCSRDWRTVFQQRICEGFRRGASQLQEPFCRVSWISAIGACGLGWVKIYLIDCALRIATVEKLCGDMSLVIIPIGPAVMKLSRCV